MPQMFAGLGLIGLGVMTVVAVAALVFSMVETPEPMSHNSHRSERPQSYQPPPNFHENNTRRRRKKPPIDQAESCCICMDSLDHNVSALECGHAFHLLCIRQWKDIGQGNSCPICRHRGL